MSAPRPTRTSKEWWDATKSDPEKIIAWLRKQAHGETMAVVRLSELIQKFGFEAPTGQWQIVDIILNQEAQHALWICDLLKTRGVDTSPVIKDKTEPYWEKTLASIYNWDHAMAIAAHAEEMRLLRIQTIVDDAESPSDIRETFRKILRDETFHAKAFKAFASNAAYGVTAESHEKGAAALGLVL